MMADKLALALDWKDGVVGKKIYVSGHGTPNDFEIAGVYDDVRVGAIGSELMGPSALFYSGRPQNTLVIKLNKMSQENMARLDETIKAMLDVGRALPASLRCTCEGGLCATPTGRQLALQAVKCKARK